PVGIPEHRVSRQQRGVVDVVIGREGHVGGAVAGAQGAQPVECLLRLVLGRVAVDHVRRPSTRLRRRLMRVPALLGEVADRIGSGTVTLAQPGTGTVPLALLVPGAVGERNDALMAALLYVLGIR